MEATSVIFFGFLLIPLLVFIIWLVKQDKKRNYLGLVLLLIGAIIAAYTIVRLDSKFMQNKTQAAPKASSFR